MDLVIAEQATLSRLPAVPSSAAEVSRRGLAGRMIFVALLGLIALAAIPYGSAELWWEALFACAIFALCALRVVDGFFNQSLRPVGLDMLAPLGLLVAFSFAQAYPWPRALTFAGLTAGETISKDPYTTWLFALRLSALILAGELLLRYTTSFQRMELLAHVVIAVGAASGLFGIVRQLAQPEDAGFILSSLWPDVGFGQFINRNHFAYLMEMTLGLVLGLVWGKAARRELLPFYLAAGAVVTIGLVMTKSRGAVLSLICQVMLLAILCGVVPRVRRRGSWARRVLLPSLAKISLGAAMAGVAATGVIWIGGSPLVERFEELHAEAEKDEDRRTSPRSEIWHMTWEMFKAHRVAGVGFGGYWMAVAKHHDASGEFTPQEAHNDLLETAASGGLIGLTLAAWACVACLRRVRRQLRSKEPFRRALSAGALAGLFAVGVHSCLDFGLHVFINALVFTVLIVLAGAESPPPEHAAEGPKKLPAAQRGVVSEKRLGSVC